MEHANGIGRYGSAVAHQRYMQEINNRSRKNCHCGCEKRATRIGMANGVCLVVGCELYIRRWLRDGVNAHTLPCEL